MFVQQQTEDSDERIGQVERTYSNRVGIVFGAVLTYRARDDQTLRAAGPCETVSKFRPDSHCGIAPRNAVTDGHHHDLAINHLSIWFEPVWCHQGG